MARIAEAWFRRCGFSQGLWEGVCPITIKAKMLVLWKSERISIFSIFKENGEESGCRDESEKRRNHLWFGVQPGYDKLRREPPLSETSTKT